MSYFPCDIPYMSEEELEENGIKIPKDDKFETYWNTVEKATELADKLKMEIAEANEWDTALAIVDEELRPILAGLQLIDMKDEARKARLKELAEVEGLDLKENRRMKTKKYLLEDGNGEVVARGVDPEELQEKIAEFFEKDKDGALLVCWDTVVGEGSEDE